jgi:hypothetical protein
MTESPAPPLAPEVAVTPAPGASPVAPSVVVPSAAAPPTATRLVARADLSAADRSAMYDLLAAHFDGVSPDRFGQDLGEKNWVVLVERAGRLVGFTTLLAYETTAPGVGPGGSPGPVSIVYSGDTIVAPEAWNTAALPRAWIESVVALRRRYPRGPFVWLLITSGFRTYRLLPVFWRSFHPRHDAPTPPARQRLLDFLAAERFGGQYDAASGVVRLADPQRLRGDLAGVPAGRAEDPHVAFFAARNPGHAAGDELACLTDLTPSNLTPAGRRMAAAVPSW